MLTELGKILRRYRSLSGSSLYRMAKDIDMGIAELSGIECGRTKPTDEQINKIACYLAGKNYKDNPHNSNAFKELIERLYGNTK